MRNRSNKELLIAVLITVILVASLRALAPRKAVPPAPARAAASPRLAELLSDAGREGYAQAIEPRDFAFPADHGPHPAFRNEWWYVTGNLDSDRGPRFGFELTIFRFSLTPALEPDAGDASAWRSHQVYIGHFALTDVAAETFHVAQRFSRGSLGLAGATADPFRVWIDDWSIAGARSGVAASEYRFGRPWRLQARDGDVAVSLTLTPRKPPVLNGVDGLSQKAGQPGNASYYYSMTRLATEGTVRSGDREYRVNGWSWLDREWGSSALSPQQQGWDWFALQLSDGSDLMFYRLRRLDGSQDAHSAGTLTDAAGQSRRLSNEDLTIEVLDTWESPHGGTYPAAWAMAVPQQGLQLELEPLLDAQELTTTVRYWEGAVDVIGRRGEEEISGRGYVELTGYAGALP